MGVGARLLLPRTLRASATLPSFPGSGITRFQKTRFFILATSSRHVSASAPLEHFVRLSMPIDAVHSKYLVGPTVLFTNTRDTQRATDTGELQVAVGVGMAGHSARVGHTMMFSPII